MRRLLFTVLSVCLLSAGAFAQTSGSPGGLVVFETFGLGVGTAATQAGVLPGVMTTRTVLFATAGARLSRNLGLAVVNPGSTATNVTMTLRRGGDGTTSAVKVITVGARQQVSKFISELFSDVPEIPVDFDGSLAIASDTPVAMVALRFRGAVFSTIPITSLTGSTPVPQVAPGVGGAGAVILPQFAAGGGWSSEIVISNTTAIPATVRVDLFKQDGTPLTTSLNGQSGSSFQNIVIPAEGILIQDNDDNGALQVGYVIVTPLDALAPTVISTVPANAATGVPINQKVTATFSEPMDPSTISTTTFTLTQGVTSIPGAVTYVGTTATFSPASNLAFSTTYTATIKTGAKDLAGNALASNFVWSFRTGAVPDTTAPTVISTVPANAATGVPINQKVTATFSKAMDPATITISTFKLQLGATNVSGTVIPVGTTATFSPLSDLLVDTTYIATITTGARDLAGNPLASNFVWSFRTGAALDTTAPTVISVDPFDTETGVALNKEPSATFSEAMEPLTAIASFSVTGPGVTPVTGTVAYDPITKIATFTPNPNLASDTTFTATITTGARDLAGNALASNYVWTFSTVAHLGPGTVPLGAAAPYAILAGAGVTNTGPTIIDGSLGTSPTGTVTGFITIDGGPGTVIHGSIDQGPAAAVAKDALTVAYLNAAGRLGAHVLAAGLDTVIFPPGLYINASSVELSVGGKVYLDAQFDPNATWVFQIGTTLKMLSGSEVVLTHGAKAANIYWQVGSSATLGTTAIFKGNILAFAAITAETGAQIEGRLLTQIEAVTLDTNHVTVPIP
jgi:hypothetical protein